MKNFISKVSAVAVVASVAFGSSAAFAKTEGTSIGFGINHNEAKQRVVGVRLNTADGAQTPFGISKSDDSSYGFNLNLKHAFNFGGIYLAPSIFYETINTDSNEATSGFIYSINSRHGAKLDLGYDISDELSVYALAGISVVDYEHNPNEPTADYDYSTQGKDSSEIFGLGLNYAIDDRLSLNVEFNRQEIDLKSLYPSNVNTVASRAADLTAATRIDSYLLAVSYKL